MSATFKLQFIPDGGMCFVPHASCVCAVQLCDVLIAHTYTHTYIHVNKDLTESLLTRLRSLLSTSIQIHYSVIALSCDTT